MGPHKTSGLRERFQLSGCRKWVGGAFGQPHRSLGAGMLVRPTFSVSLDETLGGGVGWKGA